MRDLIDRRSYLTEIVYDPERGDFTERTVAHPFAVAFLEDGETGPVPADGASIADERVARVDPVPEPSECVLLMADCPV